MFGGGAVDFVQQVVLKLEDVVGVWKSSGYTGYHNPVTTVAIHHLDRATTLDDKIDDFQLKKKTKNKNRQTNFPAIFLFSLRIFFL